MLVSPGSSVGSGLKLTGWYTQRASTTGFSRPLSRERLETPTRPPHTTAPCPPPPPRGPAAVSPGSSVGSGLKHHRHGRCRRHPPGFSRQLSRERIETRKSNPFSGTLHVSPGSSVGSGLKRKAGGTWTAGGGFSRQLSRERIETDRLVYAKSQHDEFLPAAQSGAD